MKKLQNWCITTPLILILIASVACIPSAQVTEITPQPSMVAATGNSPQAAHTTDALTPPDATPTCDATYPTPPSEACPWLPTPTPSPTSNIPTPTAFIPPTPLDQTPTPLPTLESATSPAGMLYFVAMPAPESTPKKSQLLHIEVDEQGQFGDVSGPFVWTSAEGNLMIVGRVSFSPDGKYLASVYDTEAGESVVVVKVAAAQESAYVWGGKFLNWHPNGQEFLFHQQNGTGPYGLWLVEAQNGDHSLLASSASSAAISPDGQVLAYTPNYDSIWLANGNGSEARQVQKAASSVFVWSPDGDWFLYTAYPQGSTKETAAGLHHPHLAMLEWDGVSQRTLTTTVENGLIEVEYQQPSWSPTGKYVVSTGPLDPSKEYWQKDRDTQDALYAFENAGIFVENIETGEVRQVAEHALDPVWSPDGSLLAVTQLDDQEQVDIWVMKADGSDPQRVTHTPERERYLSWLTQNYAER